MRLTSYLSRYELALEWLYQEAVRAIEQDGQSGGLDPMVQFFLKHMLNVPLNQIYVRT